MAKVKTWTKESRVFVNPYDKTCTDVLYWRVMVTGGYKEKHKASWDAEFSVSGHHGISLYATRKGELRPMQLVQREINRYNDAVEEAQRRCEEHNGES